MIYRWNCVWKKMEVQIAFTFDASELGGKELVTESNKACAPYPALITARKGREESY